MTSVTFSMIRLPFMTCGATFRNPVLNVGPAPSNSCADPQRGREFAGVAEPPDGSHRDIQNSGQLVSTEEEGFHE